MSYKFTVYGSPKLESKIMAQMETIASEVGKVFENDDLFSVVLGGGYGKGEGGVISEFDEEHTFNDYDFFVITNNISKLKKKKYDLELKKISEKLTKKFGIDVDFAFPINKADVEKLPFTQMWGELKHGYYVILGDKKVLDLYPYSDLSKLPHLEAVKLMLNRGVGLLLASEKIKKLKYAGIDELQKADIDFISRNIYKAVIGIGDARLMLDKAFHHSYVKRLELIKGKSDVSEDFKNIYSEAINFKLKPHLSFNLEQLQILLNRVIEIFKEPYYKITKNSATGCNILKNMALNFREFKFSQSCKWFFRYPRERLVFALPYFLFKDSSLSQSDVSTALNILKDSDKIDMFNQFVIIWGKFN